MRYILASKSPRRREILGNLGIDFNIVTAQTDESSELSDPVMLAEELALRKGQAVADLLKSQNELREDDVIISADTVVCCEGEILGKPQDRADAKRMLSLLSGKSHSVVSGVALIRGGKSFVSHSFTKVFFEDIPDDEIERYLDTNDAFDKAGAYGIQGLASLWVKKIDGCYFGVVGFPVNVFNELHRRCLGYPVL